MRVFVNIEQLILEGIAETDRHVMAQALIATLQQRLLDVPPAMWRTHDARYVDAGAIRITASIPGAPGEMPGAHSTAATARAATLGSQVAVAIARQVATPQSGGAGGLPHA